MLAVFSDLATSYNPGIDPRPFTHIPAPQSTASLLSPSWRLHRQLLVSINKADASDAESDKPADPEQHLDTEDGVLLRRGIQVKYCATSLRDGIGVLEFPDIARYIYLVARFRGKTQQGHNDLRELHVAHVKASFGVSRGLNLLHPSDITRTISETFAFHMCGHMLAVTSAAFLSATRVVSGSWDGTVRVWDVCTGAMIPSSPCARHSDAINCVAVYPLGGLVASASRDSTVRVRKSDRNGVVHAGTVLEGGAKRDVCAVTFAPDGSYLVSGSSDGAIRAWNTVTYKRMGEPARGHTGAVRSIAFSPEGTRLVSGSDDGTGRLWEWVPEDGAARVACGGQLNGHTDRVYSVAFSPTARVIASGSRDWTVRVWDADTRATRLTLEGHSHPVNSVAFAPSGEHLASASNDWTVRIWDARTGAAVQVLRGHTDWVLSVAFSPDGARLASGSDDKTVRVWDFNPDADGLLEGEDSETTS